MDSLLVEALRRKADPAIPPPGLIRGLADLRIGVALQKMHAKIGRRWTMAALAKEAALSRSVFFERFTKTVGIPPMTYGLGWRLALAKTLLRRGDLAIDKLADQVGYRSASSFGTTFKREIGVSPGRFA